MSAVVIICQQCQVSQIQRMLNETAHIDWESQYRIRIYPWVETPPAKSGTRPFHTPRRGGSRRWNTNDQIEDLLNPSNNTNQQISAPLPTIFLLGQQAPRILDSYAKRTRIRTFQNGLTDLKKDLPSELQRERLDWKTHLIDKFSNSSFSGVNRESLDAYLSQFSALGRPDFGRDLLRLVDIWPQERIVKQLTGFNDAGSPLHSHSESISWLQTFDALVYFDKGLCSSSGTISHLLKTRYGAEIEQKSHSFDEFLFGIVNRNSDSGKRFRILFLEDGILTGTESIGFINRILGAQPTFFAQNSCVFRFAFGTRYGIIRLSSALGSQNHISIPGTGLLENLSAHASSHLSIDAPMDDRRPPAGSGWTVPEVIIRANGNGALFPTKRLTEFSRFLSSIGRQLIEPRVRAKPIAEWTPQDKHSVFPFYNFGWSGLGLTTMFYHSAPAPLIPALVYGGRIRLKPSQTAPPIELEWKPLINR